MSLTKRKRNDKIYILYDASPDSWYGISGRVIHVYKYKWRAEKKLKSLQLSNPHTNKHLEIIVKEVLE